MRNPETDAKAEGVRRFLVGKNVVIAEHHYGDRPPTDDPRDVARLRQREWYYRYLLQDKAGATEIRVTLDAMREGEVDDLGHMVLEARRRKAQGDPGSVWIEMVDGRPSISLEA